MKISLNAGKTLREVQQEFQYYFPLLKVEFYYFQHKVAEGSSPGHQLEHQLSLADINPSFAQADWTFTESTTVCDLEDQFYEISGISVQVFRQTASSWIQTIATDNWTLAEQQQEAQELLKKEARNEPPDYHEQL